MKIQEILSWGVGAVVAVASLLEVSKLKINPWTAFFRLLGRAINADLLKEIESMQKRMEQSEQDRAEQDAIELRRRILLFGDEVARGVKHSEEHFNQILQDMTDYETYCQEHEDFKNDKTVITSERIKEAYKHCLKTGDFL